MVDQVKLRALINQELANLESYWSLDVPEALGENDWSEDALIIFCEEARGVPAEKYRNLLKNIGNGFQTEYSERLERLNELIQKYEPGLKNLLGCS